MNIVIDAMPVKVEFKDVVIGGCFLSIDDSQLWRKVEKFKLVTLPGSPVATGDYINCVRVDVYETRKIHPKHEVQIVKIVMIEAQRI